MSEIKEANIEFKRQLSVKWIKAASGHTYLCPVDALKRFDNPSELMSYLGLVPSEHSSGETSKRGNRHGTEHGDRAVPWCIHRAAGC